MIIKKIFILINIFFIFFIYNKSSLANEISSFTLDSNYLWEIPSCEKFPKKYLKGGEFSSEIFFEPLEYYNTPGVGAKTKTWEDSFLLLNEAIHKVESNGEDITEKIKNGERLCPDKNSDHKIIIKTKPIYYFISEACGKKMLSDQDVLNLLDLHLDEKKLGLYRNKETNKYSIKENTKFLQENIYDYNRYVTGIRCDPFEQTHFTVKNINSFLPDNIKPSQMSNIEDEATTDEDKNSENEITNCKDFDLTELRQEVENGNRNDCREILTQKEEENQKIIQTNNERNNLNTQLDDLIKFYNINNIAKLIADYSESIDQKLSYLEDELINISEVDFINDELILIEKEIDDFKIIFSLFESYENICETFSEIKLTDASEYTDKCKKIKGLKTDDNEEFERRSIYVLDRKKILDKILENFTELVSSSKLRIKEINDLDNKVLEQTRQKNELQSAINSAKTPKELLTKKINSKFDILKNQNNKFDKTEVFNEHKDLTSVFENDLNTIKQILNNIKIKYKSYDGNDKNLILDSIDELEEEINSFDILINKYVQEYLTYKQNLKIRDEYLIEQKNLKEEKARQKAEKDKKEAENKKRLKEEAKKAQEEKKIKETITNINNLEKDINSSLKSFEAHIEDEITTLNTFIDNFKATNDDLIDFNVINSKIQKNEKLINKYLQEYGDAISSLPSDFDHQKFDFYSIDDLTDNKIIFKRELKDLQEVISDKLDLKINEAKTLINSREDQLVQIVSETSEELLLKEQELENTEAEKQKLEEEKRIAEEKNKQKEQLIDEKTGEIRSKDQTILTLQNDIKILESNLVIEQENVSNRNLMIYLLIGLSIILAGLLIYFIIRKKPTSSNADEGYVSKINELEQRLEKEMQQSRAQANNQTTTPIKTEAPKEIKKEPTQEEIKNEQLRKLYEDYNAAMKNPNLIETFQSNYNAIGLERESKISTGRKVRLRRVNTSFDRAIFWVVEHDRKLLVFGGRMLKVQAPSLLADDGTMARDLLQGIFALQTGPDLKTHKCAIVHKNNQIYEVMMEGTLQLPRID